MLVFPALSTIAHLTFSLVHPPPLPKVQVQYMRTVCGWKVGVGVLSCVGDHILQEFNSLFLTDSEPTKLFYQPKQKFRRGGGLSNMNSCSKVPLQVNGFR
jgi:hypothetical protein